MSSGRGRHRSDEETQNKAGYQRRKKQAQYQITQNDDRRKRQQMMKIKSRRVEAKIAAGSVACLAHIRDMDYAKRLATDDFGHNAARAVMVNRP